MKNITPLKIKYLFLVIGLSYITGLYPVTTDIYLIIVFLICALYFTQKGFKYDRGIFYIILFFSLINFISIFFFGPIQLSTFFGMILRLLIPYYIIKIIGEDFIYIFEKTIYFFAIFSIPFYLLQFIIPGFFLNLTPYFEPMMTDIRYNAHIYNYMFHTVHFDSLTRNSGFTWEPGGFGYVIGIAIMFNVIRQNFTLSKRTLLLLLVGITTLSTTFYIFILFLLIFYLYKKKRNLAVLVLGIPIIIIISIYTIQLPFVGDKIDANILNTQKMQKQNFELLDIEGVGRFYGFIIDFNKFVNYPLGYGVNTGASLVNTLSEFVNGPSGLGRFLSIWGLAGFIYLILSINNLSNKLSIKYHTKQKMFIMMTILLFLFSNPIEREPTFLMLLYFPAFILRKTNLTQEINNSIKQIPHKMEFRFYEKE